MYRLQRGLEVYYLRLAEEADEDLSVDAELHRQLRECGVRVPEVVHVEPFDEAIGRSIMITTEVPGSPLSEVRSRKAAEAVVREAGRELALLNQVPVQGFGWLRRDRVDWPPCAELASYAEFVVSYLPSPWPGPLRELFGREDLDQVESLIEDERERGLEIGSLAHGDFDPTAVFQKDGEYTGVIDFGEARGTEPTFDLGHFLLHDGERLAWPLFESLVAGYRDVVDPPPDLEARGRRSAVLLGLRQLCRWIGPERAAALDHPAVQARARRLKELLAMRS